VPGSDIDILIVLSADTRRFGDRILEYLNIFENVGIATVNFPYTIAELDTPLVKTALATGKILFERPLTLVESGTFLSPVCSMGAYDESERKSAVADGDTGTIASPGD
jgi:hypothetical protein